MKDKWITFDLDGTLMQNPFVEWVFPEISSIVREENDYNEDIHIHMITEHRNRMTNNKIVEAYDWDDIFKEISSKNKLNTSLEIEEIVIRHSVEPKVFLLEENLLESLTKLKEKGFKLAAVTNGYYKYQLPVLEETELLPYFDLVVTPDKYGYAKPNINMLEKLKREIRVVAHVGDRIDHDIVFANDLEITSVLIYKNMPEELCEINPWNRIESKISLDYCKSKWLKETSLHESEVKENQRPKIIINSIRELITLF